MTGQTHYEILGVTEQVSPEELKRCYRRLALEFHPDRNHTPGANARFVGINEAYQVLSDPLKRRQYDRRLAQIRQGYTSPPPPVVWKQPDEATNVQPETTFTDAYFNAKKAQERRNAAEFSRYFRPVRISSAILLAFGIFLLMDWGMQKERGPLPIEAVGYTVGSSFSYAQLLMKDGVIELPSPWERLLEPGDLVTWRQSRFLGICTEVSLNPQGDKERLAWLWKEMKRQPELAAFGTPFSPKAHLYGVFAPAWILMILTALTGLLFPKSYAERLFQIGLLGGFFGVFTLIFLMLS